MKPEREAPEGIAPKSGAERTPLDWPRQTGRLDRVMAAIEVRQKRQRRRRIQAGVASLSVLALATVIWVLGADGGGRAPAAPVNQVIVSLPERRTLPDGSAVELKAGSRLTVDFSGALRRVVLTNGEAHFQVTKDPSRPFVVAAGGMEFRAVGTAFAVQLSLRKVEMLVTEGHVAVERAAATAAPSAAAAIAETKREPLAVVAAGNQVVVDLARPGAADVPKITPITAAESGEKLAWRVPRLELNDTPLSEAIAAINRHSLTPLEIGDAELGRVGISGVLQADNVEPLLRMLESNYRIRTDRRASGKIILRKGE